MCPTGEFKECTILFSDVVTFTNICAMCEPIQIVHMLNSMYLQFDRLTTVHNVYKVNMNGVTCFFACTFHWKRKEPFMHFHKAFGYGLVFFPSCHLFEPDRVFFCFYQVETIGDAYMVVGGVPIPVSSHAERVANFALGMIMAAKAVINPITGGPIQVQGSS